MADVRSQTDYSAFHVTLDDRQWYSTTDSNEYRFGINGQERDDEIYGAGNSYTAEYWQYDPRLGRRWNVDPKGRFSESSYAVFWNLPTRLTDLNGDEVDIAKLYEKKDGKYLHNDQIKAFELFASTTEGKQYILDHAKKGFKLDGVHIKTLKIEATEDGKAHKKGIDVSFTAKNLNSGNEAQTEHKVEKERLKITFVMEGRQFRFGTTPEALLRKVGAWSHEIFYHGDIYEARFALYKEGKIKLNGNGTFLWTEENYWHTYPISKTMYGKVGVSVLVQTQNLMRKSYGQLDNPLYKSDYIPNSWDKEEYEKILKEKMKAIIVNELSRKQLIEIYEYGF